MNRTQIYLPRKQIEVLRREAARKHTTVSGVIRGVLEERFEPARNAKRERPHETLLEFARRVNLGGKRAPRDLAKNLDKYLYGGK